MCLRACELATALEVLPRQALEVLLEVLPQVLATALEVLPRRRHLIRVLWGLKEVFRLFRLCQLALLLARLCRSHRTAAASKTATRACAGRQTRAVR